MMISSQRNCQNIRDFSCTGSRKWLPSYFTGKNGSKPVTVLGWGVFQCCFTIPEPMESDVVESLLLKRYTADLSLID
jgi:hypothetical protein